MLTARHEGRQVFAPGADRARVKTLDKEDALRCPVCEQHVSFKAGERVMWHFAHRPGASTCPVERDPDYRPESVLHLQAKRVLARWLKRQSGPGTEVDTEVLVPETGQVVDVLLTRLSSDEEDRSIQASGGTASPQRFAFEVQCSPISGRRWKERAALYAEAGVADTWLLAGKKHLTHLEKSGTPTVYFHETREGCSARKGGEESRKIRQARCLSDLLKKRTLTSIAA